VPGHLLLILPFFMGGVEPLHEGLLGQFVHASEAWITLYHQERPHESLENLSPLHAAQHHHVQDSPSPAF
jgi:hypothetical protein